MSRAKAHGSRSGCPPPGRYRVGCRPPAALEFLRRLSFDPPGESFDAAFASG